MNSDSESESESESRVSEEVGNDEFVIDESDEFELDLEMPSTSKRKIKTSSKSNKKLKSNNGEAPEHDQRNPLGVQSIDIIQNIIERKFVVGPPPPGRGCSSSNWTRGMKFIYFEDGREVTNCFFFANYVVGSLT